MLHLSQGLLNLLTLCPRKFQYTYLDQLNVPIAPEQQERINWGNRFHLLMQQRELGLKLDPEGLPEDRQIHHSVETFIQSVPELFSPSAFSSRQSEHGRSLHFQGYLFTVIYDLLILDRHEAQILDWKTYPRPQKPDWLLQNWQTRLYPFVLAETSEYKPDQISMTYWFVQPSPDGLKPQCFKFSYSEAQHQQTYQDLTTLLDRFTHSLQRYQETRQPFPQTQSLKPCEVCAFALRCQRGQLQPPQDEAPLVTLEEIPEVAL
ncbi:MAG: PD-(D/E)XK nuclease family protein [Drouetiella hepatica Uher 2000/2452]|jgi:hypothetical protein|uniref:PD-(D/E)XK nuclease family protein n=1 Tax=Drouetiella hepatica Uher 2000/2452 TaxID=904376 RepID=A0A951QEL2_9CYAN|nr:PD-(D/E)XK nuclease family protein [Drouetiella hepatica Uher 2000/2452]